ncbi:MAG: ribosomal protein S18-alanine N-acetyltransferase [Bacteroides sp.]|nr:ribosomal protein S18-alanine N-acetyltransferase [Eubacterium sp.]MCM1419247.1 ribosomal protein S18-alanine N-acetyltransferase [Roseburia sp.]MCM1461404.1 ribosomal protein S18-alanine N-acetyltransferase [Bacteroides sp.]
MREAEEIAAIERACFTEPWSVPSVEAQLKSGSAILTTARDGGRLVGYAVGAGAFDEAELYRLAVLPEARRRGYGAGLLDDFLKACFRRGASRVFLEARSKNTPALSLYQKAGFIEIARRRGYYGDDDAVVMERIFIK